MRTSWALRGPAWLPAVVLTAMWWLANMASSLATKRVLREQPVALLVTTLQLVASAVMTWGEQWLGGVRLGNPPQQLKKVRSSPQDEEAGFTVGRLPKSSPKTNQANHNLWVALVATLHFTGHTLTSLALSAGSVSMTQIIKAAEPLSTAAVAAVLGAQALPSRKRLLCLGLLTVGLAYASSSKGGSGESSSQQLLLILFALGANMSFSLRNVAIKMCPVPKADVMPLVSLGSAGLGVCVLLIEALVNGPGRLSGVLSLCQSAWGSGNSEQAVAAWRWLTWLGVAAVCHPLYNIFSVRLLQQVKPITHAVLNAAKRVFVIAASVVIFSKPMSGSQVVAGLFVLGGAFAFSLLGKLEAPTSSKQHPPRRPPDSKPPRLAQAGAVILLLFVVGSVVAPASSGTDRTSRDVVVAADVGAESTPLASVPTFASLPSTLRDITSLLREHCNTLSAQLFNIRASGGPYRVYVYDWGKELSSDLEDDLRELKGNPRCPRCWLSQFASEAVIHEYFLSSPHRTMDPEEADFFFVPMYAHAMLRLQLEHKKQGNAFPSHLANKLDAIATLDAALRSAVVDGKYDLWEEATGLSSKYWRANAGADHILVASHPPFHNHWLFLYGTQINTAPHFLTLELPRSEMLYTMQSRGAGGASELLAGSWKNVIIPYPTFSRMHELDSQTGRVVDGPERTLRSFTAAGYKTHHNLKKTGMRLRAAMHKQANGSDSHAFWEFASAKMTSVEDMYAKSIFCPCPSGDTPSARRFFTVLDYGCIPVVISGDVVLPFKQFIDYRSFVVFLPESTVWTAGQWMRILDEMEASTISKLQHGIRVYREFLRLSDPPKPSESDGVAKSAYSVLDMYLAAWKGFK